MITLHHLAFLRSLRVLRVLEELGLDYDLVCYAPTKDFGAPPEMARIHPLGKSPVIIDGDLVLAESSAILRYIHGRYGAGRLTPPVGTAAYALHDEWLDYVESSAGTPVTLKLLGNRMGGFNEDITAFAKRSLAKTLDYIAARVGEKPFLMAEQAMLADMQMSYILAPADMVGALEGYPALAAYLDRIKHHPGMMKAVAKGGSMTPPKA